MKFKVGDFITGTDVGFDTYAITNERMICGQVTCLEEIDSDGELIPMMEVKIIDHEERRWIGNSYWVKPDYFELIEYHATSLSEPDYDSLLRLFEGV